MKDNVTITECSFRLVFKFFMLSNAFVWGTTNGGNKHSHKAHK